jgi:hypothetical protein
MNGGKKNRGKGKGVGGILSALWKVLQFSSKHQGTSLLIFSHRNLVQVLTFPGLADRLDSFLALFPGALCLSVWLISADKYGQPNLLTFSKAQ